MTREGCSCLVGCEVHNRKGFYRGRYVWTANRLAWILVCWFWFLVVVWLGCGCFESHGRFGDCPEWGGWLVGLGGDPHVGGTVFGGGGGSGRTFVCVCLFLVFLAKGRN